jgi:predicted permease
LPSWFSPVEGKRRASLVSTQIITGRKETREQHRSHWWLGTVVQDIRYALRGFRRNPLFSISVVLTLALGIGATTAVFSVVDRVLFRPLPYKNADRIVSLGMVHSLERQEFLMGRSYLEWKDNQRPFSAIAGQSTYARPCDLVEVNPAQINCISFQAGFLPLFGISPLLGRNFSPEEDRPNGPPVVIISYALWKGHYGGDPRILDRSINVDGVQDRVVGVLPAGFQFPTLETADVVFPMRFNSAIQQTVNGGFGNPMRLFARLRPGISIAQAYAEMMPLFDDDLKWFPVPHNEIRLSIRSLRDRETRDVQPVSWILLGFVLAVLLIACANVASLMMARGASRSQELAVRSALGASRSRLVRQALTEALLLSFAGAVVGLAIARGLLTVFVSLAPTGIPFLHEAHLDLRIAAFTMLLSIVCGALFGLAFALQKPGSATLNARASISRSHASLRRSLVILQIAASIILLSGAGLLLRSFEKIEQQNLGMQTGGVLTVKVALPGFRYNTPQKSMEFYLNLESALQRLPGTRAVGIADSIPPGGWESGFRYADLQVEGRPRTAPGTGGTGVSRRVTPDYFRALHTPIVRGRNFTDQDRNGTQPEVILSRLLAARLFPGEDPIGKRFQNADGSAGSVVVGVADNVKNGGLTGQDSPEMYSLWRNVGEDWAGNRVIILVDSVLTTASIEPWVRSQIASLDRTVPVEMEPLNQTVNALADRPRFETALLAFFAFTGLMLAVIGLYGLLAFMTSRRTQEIGVRMALGATRTNILRLIAHDGLRMVLAGGALGLVVALATSRILKSLLFQVSIYDPFTLIAAPVLLCLVALVAIVIPARAGMKVEPSIALRNE